MVVYFNFHRKSIDVGRIACNNFRIDRLLNQSAIPKRVAFSASLPSKGGFEEIFTKRISINEVREVHSSPPLEGLGEAVLHLQKLVLHFLHFFKEIINGFYSFQVDVQVVMQPDKFFQFC